MREQIAVAEANVERFADFSRMVHAQVESGLEPGADASLADAQLANARNDLVRARLNYELARASLAQAVGLGGQPLDINPGGIAVITEPVATQKSTPLFEMHPLAVEGKAYIATYLAQRNVLNKEYYPRFRWLGGMNFRGTTFLGNNGDVPVENISGIFPYIPNWQVGMMIEWMPSDIFRIRAERRVIDERVAGARQGYAAVMQALQTQDAQARARVRAAVELAANMPVQVRAAELAARQAQARYKAGLATVAQVAEANQLLAESRVKQAVANVGVWRALLDVASVHGDLKPFIAEADRATGRGTQ
jgi:outer membrane protein